MRAGSAHVAPDGIHLKTGKGVEDGRIDQVACMDDGLATGESLANLVLKQLGTVIEMGVRKDADSLHATLLQEIAKTSLYRFA